MSKPKALSVSQRRRRIAYLLVCLAEEAGEVAKEAHKALRFGPDDLYLGRSPIERLRAELLDMHAIQRMLNQQGLDMTACEEGPDEDAICSKQQRVLRHMATSRATGLIKPD
jgi:hypothetical protein